MFFSLQCLTNCCCISRLSIIVRVSVVLNRTVLVDSDWHFDNLYGVKVSCIKLVDGIEIWLLTSGQLSCDVIGPLSVKRWYYWLWRLLNAIGAFWSVYLSQFNSCLLLVKLSIKLSIIQSFCSCQFCLPSESVNVVHTVLVTTVLCRTTISRQSCSTYLWNYSQVQTFHKLFFNIRTM